MTKEIVKTKDEVINELYEYNKEMQAELARLGEAGLECAAVISTSDKHAILSNGIYAINNNYKPGQNVLVWPRTGQVVEVLPDIPLVGELFVLDKVLDDEYAELRVKGERKRVLTGKFKNLKVGDVVLLDNSNKIIQALIERVNTAPRISKPITWKDIGGNEEAKERLIEAIELPHKHPKLYKAYTQRNTKGILLKGPPGCVDGDALVQVNRAGATRTYALREIVARFNGETFRGTDRAKHGRTRHYAWDLKIPTYIRCYHNGEFRLRKLIGAYPKGIKPVVKVTLSNGRSVRMTADHEVLTKYQGWKRADNLTPQQIVLTNGIAAPASFEEAQKLGSSKYLDRKGYWWVTSGLKNHPFFTEARKTKSDSYDMPVHRLVAEAKLNGLSYEEWLLVIQSGVFGNGNYKFLTSKDQVHHKDEDTTNNHPDNLEVVTQSEHSKLHQFHKHIPVFLAKDAIVLSVEPDGETEVFDLTVDEAHNFLANGLIVHNCGKTLLGKASATSIGAEDGFISIKGPEVLDPYVGVAEANVRSAFIKARAYKEVTGRPAVIFIDEAEALLTARGRQYNHMGQTIVPTFLTEMDGIDDSSAIVILSTNRDDMLDPAITRDERIDFQVEVKRPLINEAKEIMFIHLNGKPIAPKHDNIGLIELATEELYLHTHLPFSGALLAGCVHKAVAHALQRDIANNGKITGLSPVDFEWATQQIIKQDGKTGKEIQATKASW